MDYLSKTHSLAWHLVLLCAMLLCLLPARVSATQPVVQVLHNSFVSAEKFQQLQAFATQAGVELRHTNVERSTAQAVREAIAGANLVLLDGPRAGDRALLEKHMAPEATDISPARLTVGGGRPAWHGLPSPIGSALTSHYSAGRQQGFQRFFALLKVWHEGGTPAPELLSASAQLPATGFYHPDAPQVFTQAADYLAWHATTKTPAAHGKVAFLVSRGVVSDLVTHSVDALIRRSEAAGLLPLVFWADGNAAGGLAGILGGAGIDALLTSSPC